MPFVLILIVTIGCVSIMPSIAYSTVLWWVDAAAQVAVQVHRAVAHLWPTILMLLALATLIMVASRNSKSHTRSVI